MAKPKTQKHVNPYLISREDLRYFIRHDAIGAEKFREVLRAVNEVEKKHGSAFIYWNLDGTFTVRTRKDPEGWGPGTTVAAVPKPLAPKPPTPKPALKKPKPKPVQPKERRIKSFLKT